ncbi:MAG: hypothetical protein OXE86_11265 [Alphaproteobacteria bacterium]|nr:hypothetical protein [Alphaproteobacteria bacterium]
MNTWSFMPRCPRCHAHPDMPCGADPARDPATCPAFEIHAAAIGYHAIADEAPDDPVLPPSPFG